MLMLMLKSNTLSLTTRCRAIAIYSHRFWFSTSPSSQRRKWMTNIDSADARDALYNPVGRRITRKEKNNLLIKALSDLGDSKDEVYGALDAWVAWEQYFPMAALKHVLLTLEKEQQWHRIVQVLKWMLSKGEGNTMGTYQQLIRALDMDHRAEEAHWFWMKKIGNNLHSVPWQACHLMISVYFRNLMFDRIIQLFKALEAFDRKPRDKLIVEKVADAYYLLDLKYDQERVLAKYNYLLNKKPKEFEKNSKRVTSKRKLALPGSSSSLANALEA